MAHFAKLGKGNKVEKVIVVSNDIAINEQAGVDFINNLYGTNDIWKQTSYNTRGGKYYSVNENGDMAESEDQSKAFRKNFAGIDYKYDQTRNAFIAPQPFNSWTLNETTCMWQPPVAKPQLTQEQLNNNNYYKWNEDTRNWDLK
jgi:hypothetical protein